MAGLPKGGSLGTMYQVANATRIAARKASAKIKRDKLRKQLKKEEAEGTGPKLETEPAPPIKEVQSRDMARVLKNQKPVRSKDTVTYVIPKRKVDPNKYDYETYQGPH